MPHKISKPQRKFVIEFESIGEWVRSLTYKTVFTSLVRAEAQAQIAASRTWFAYRVVQLTARGVKPIGKPFPAGRP